jgi:hypothetical protein
MCENDQVIKIKRPEPKTTEEMIAPIGTLVKCPSCGIISILQKPEGCYRDISDTYIDVGCFKCGARLAILCCSDMR